MGETIPVCDLEPQIQRLRAELDAAIARVLQRGWFVLGEEGAGFEREFAAYLGARFVVGVANGTDAIQLALRAAGIGAGDRVLIPPSTANPTAAAVVAAGARPCFADVDIDTGLFDLASLSRAVERERPTAILPVHLYGRPEDLDAVQELARSHGAALIEDAAQAHGARWRGRCVGSFGAFGCFSFYPTKNLGALGDGGAVATADAELAEKLRRLRNYGQSDRYQHVSFGLNSRLDELQAAILRVKLPHLEAGNRRRAEIAARYRAGLAGLPLALPAAEDARGACVHHLFVVRVARRERFREALRVRGVGSEIHYPVPIHRQPVFAALGLAPGSFPNAERRADQIVSLPIFPELRDDQVDRVIAAARDALRGEAPPEPAA